jgi:hypothetical protein
MAAVGWVYVTNSKLELDLDKIKKLMKFMKQKSLDQTSLRLYKISQNQENYFTFFPPLPHNLIDSVFLILISEPLYFEVV